MIANKATKTISIAFNIISFKPSLIKTELQLIETAVAGIQKQTKHFTTDLKTLAFAYHLMMASHISTKKKALWIRTHQHPP